MLARLASPLTLFSLTPITDPAAAVGVLAGLVPAAAGAVLLWWCTRDLPWPTSAKVIFSGLGAAACGYIGYTVLVTLPQVPAQLQPLSWLLLGAEVAVLTMGTAYTFYSVDAYARREWRRAPGLAQFDPGIRPRVAFHVPTFNEPPHIVIDTLKHILALDYPKDLVSVIVVDDSTDAELWKPVEAFCRDHGLDFVHRRNRQGFKAGALNVALQNTPASVELIAVLDADFQVDADFLRATVGYFTDPKISFVQTAQDFRNGHQSFLAGFYRLAQRYFYECVMPVRNEESAAIFCGTMGLLRRRVLEEVGGWDETCIAEDAEVSVRVLARGYTSLYLRKVFGVGLTVHTFEAFRKQQCRWAFGNVQLLRRHGGALVTGKFRLRQRLDFLVGCLQWFDGAFIFVIAAVMLAVSLAAAAGASLSTFHSRQAGLLGVITILPFVHSLVRLHLALRKGLGLTVRQSVGVLCIWLCVKMAVAGSALRAAMGGRIAFARTGKVPDAPLPKLVAVLRAVRITPFESTMAAALGAACLLSVPAAMADLGNVALVASLMFYAGLFALAPIFAFMSYITLVPAEARPPLAQPLQRRRRDARGELAAAPLTAARGPHVPQSGTAGRP